MTRSRILAQEVSRARESDRPSDSAKPFSFATISGAQSTSGIKPSVRQTPERCAASLSSSDAARALIILLLAQQLCGGDQAARDVGDAAALVHRGFTQKRIGLFLGNIAAFHQDALGLVDDFAVFKRLFGAVQLIAKAMERVEPADRHIEDRFDALLA